MACSWLRRLAGVEHGAHVSQFALNLHCERMRAAEDAPYDPFRILKRCYGLAEIVKRGATGVDERRHVIRPHLERERIIVSENASRHGSCFAQQWPSFFEVL